MYVQKTGRNVNWMVLFKVWFFFFFFIIINPLQKQECAKEGVFICYCILTFYFSTNIVTANMIGSDKRICPNGAICLIFGLLLSIQNIYEKVTCSCHD